MRVGVIGDFNPQYASHAATNEALQHAAQALGVPLEIEWVPTPALAAEAESALRPYDALWAAPATPYRSLAGALRGIHFARTQNRPFTGT